MKIVIPKPDTWYQTIIAKGSGIVMLDRKDDELIPSVIYYEGNLYGAENLSTYEERIRCAAGRAFTKYPTVAFAGVLEENLKEFIIVGFCSPEEQYRIVFSMGSGPIIKKWLS